jgi:dTDP-4-amino-4,6-dideoxygalactose transaminase
MGLLFEKGIATRRGVMNAHQEEPYRKARFVLKNSEAARDSVILMPLYSDMREGHIKNIAGIIQSAS